MSDPQPGTEPPYQVDDAWSRAVFARRTGAGAAFFLQHLRPGMRLIDCGSAWLHYRRPRSGGDARRSHRH